MLQNWHKRFASQILNVVMQCLPTTGLLLWGNVPRDKLLQMAYCNKMRFYSLSTEIPFFQVQSLHKLINKHFQKNVKAPMK